MLNEFKTFYRYKKNSNTRFGEGGKRLKKIKKQNKPLFSIITVVLNNEKYLEQTIKSVLNQSYKNYEYIIVESGSTDNSKEIIKKTLNTIKNDRIRLIEYKNVNNPIERWNLPLKYATGEYIVVIEGDDWFEKNILRQPTKK